jgi:ribonucrease Y
MTMQGLEYGIIGIVLGGLIVFGYLHFMGRAQKVAFQTQKEEAQRALEVAKQQAETLKREALVEAKDEAHTLRKQIEEENRAQRSELLRTQRRLQNREENVERRAEQLERRQKTLTTQESEIERKLQEVDQTLTERRTELQRISHLTVDEAKALLLADVENDTRQDAAKLIREIEEEARTEGDRRARKIVSLAIQRCAVDQASESTVSVVALPSDEMKGRIIGREGRNIRCFEQLTGVDLVIDDTPEAVVISGFDPVRREVARHALETLVTDGRIHPGRIEEVINKAKILVEEKISVAADRAAMETGVTGIHPEILRLLGKMQFRTTLGQNALEHSIEVSHLAGMMAAEIGANEALSRRAGLLHDIGKAVDFEREGTHTSIGVELARRYGESEAVIHAIAAHHEDVEATSLEAVLVAAGDAISASRPGARKESLENYIKRLQRLEEIADSCRGVDKAYAIQAGREMRIIVKPDDVDDLGAIQLAKEIAGKVEESDVEYPGQVKITVIRETRATEYAK